jgi:hypothetical protein
VIPAPNLDVGFVELFWPGTGFALIRTYYFSTYGSPYSRSSGSITPAVGPPSPVQYISKMFEDVKKYKLYLLSACCISYKRTKKWILFSVIADEYPGLINNIYEII